MREGSGPPPPQGGHQPHRSPGNPPNPRENCLQHSLIYGLVRVGGVEHPNQGGGGGNPPSQSAVVWPNRWGFSPAVLFRPGWGNWQGVSPFLFGFTRREAAGWVNNCRSAFPPPPLRQFLPAPRLEPGVGEPLERICVPACPPAQAPSPGEPIHAVFRHSTVYYFEGSQTETAQSAWCTPGAGGSRPVIFFQAGCWG